MELAEALSLAMFPGSVPYYVRAAEVWRQLIVDDGVPAPTPVATPWQGCPQLTAEATSGDMSAP